MCVWKGPAGAPNRRQFYLFYWSSRAGAARFWGVTFLEWPPHREPQFPKFCLHQPPWCLGPGWWGVALKAGLTSSPTYSPVSFVEGEGRDSRAFPEGISWKMKEIRARYITTTSERGWDYRENPQTKETKHFLILWSILPFSWFNFSLSLLEKTDIFLTLARRWQQRVSWAPAPPKPPVVTLSNSYEDIGLFWGEMTR